jgi:hypothetical protein
LRVEGDLFLIRDLFSVFSEPSVAKRNRQRKHTAFELGHPNRKPQRPELVLEKNHGKGRKIQKEEAAWMASHAHAADAT